MKLLLVAGLILAEFFTGSWYGRNKLANQHKNELLNAVNEGFKSGETYGREKAEQELRRSKPQHNYQFRQHDASIYRLDKATGSSCWVQLSVGDKNSPLMSCESEDQLNAMEGSR